MFVTQIKVYSVFVNHLFRTLVCSSFKGMNVWKLWHKLSFQRTESSPCLNINYQLWTMLGFGINNKSNNRRWVNRVGRYQIGWTVLMVISCKVYIRRVYSFISHSYWFRAELLPLIWSNIPCSRVCIKNFIVCNFKATKLHRNDKQYKNTTTQS